MKVSEIPSDISSKIIPNYQISAMRIFGSTVRDDFSDENDIDIICQSLKYDLSDLLRLLNND